MRSQQLIDVLKKIVKADIRKGDSVINFFLATTYSGGWETWLQAVYAKGVFDAALGVKDFNREVDFPGVAQRCDLFFQGGTGIWVELQTQRNRTDATGFA